MVNSFVLFALALPCFFGARLPLDGTEALVAGDPGAVDEPPASQMEVSGQSGKVGKGGSGGKGGKGGKGSRGQVQSGQQAEQKRGKGLKHSEKGAQTQSAQLAGTQRQQVQVPGGQAQMPQAPGGQAQMPQASGDQAQSAQLAGGQQQQAPMQMQQVPQVPVSTGPAQGGAQTQKAAAQVAGTASCSHAEIGVDSIWAMRNSHPSCQGAFKKDGSGMCSGDPTSITMDLSKVADKVGCYVWEARQCEWKMTEFKSMEFDAEWSDCDDLWIAPLWLTPSPWKPPQGKSGEIDLIESCKGHRGTVGTSIICNDHHRGDPNCKEPKWGKTSGGSGHFVGKIDQGSGTWTLHKDGELISQYPAYTKTIWDAKFPFHLVSDIYNGGNGDAGWHGCGTLNKKTNCMFKVKNIKIEGPTFSGKCAALNR